MKLKSILLIGLLILSAFPAFSQFSQSGTDFWLCFMQNFKESKTSNSGSLSGPSSALTLTLYISSESNARVYISCKSGNYSTSLELEPNKMSTIMLPSDLQITTSNEKSDKGIHITSDQKITVNALSSRLQTTDGFTVLPVESTGNEYTAISRADNQGLLSELAIVATEDGTEIKIKSDNIKKASRGINEVIEIQLNKGETFQLNSDYNKYNLNDLTGTMISSNKKISVFSGHQCSYVPQEILACNFLAEQLLPKQFAGNTFFVSPLQMRSKYSIKIIGQDENTILVVNGKDGILLNKGEAYQNDNLDENLTIKSGKPITVTQFSQGNRSGDNVGDPMMILIRPENIYQTSYDINIPNLENFENFVNVIIPIEGLDNLNVDGKPVKPEKFNEFIDSRMVSFTLKLLPGCHIIKSTIPFGISTYGFGKINNDYDAYGWM